MKRETVEKIAEARRRFLQADEAIYGARTLGREAESVETLVRARANYQEALDEGERELGLRS